MSTPTSAPDPIAQHELTLARDRQNLVLAIAAGAVTAALSAIAWAAITATTGFQIGFMAIGVGIAVGYAVRVAGRGLDTGFRAVAAALALLGCACGNLLVACVYYAEGNEIGVLRVLEVLDLDLALFLMQAMFSPIDLLFYAIAVWEAWRLSVVDAPGSPHEA